jgi:DNA protecting protein DprA
MMQEDLREQACWLLLAIDSGLKTHVGLTTRIVNDILVVWCHQAKRSLQEFFAANADEWRRVCHLGDEQINKLEQAREKLVSQAFVVEQLAHEGIHMLTVLDKDYPKLLKTTLKREQAPPVLFYMGDLAILERKTIAIIGSREANEESLAFTQSAAAYLADHEANVISGYARGVDRSAFEGATSVNGYTTVVLPHGIRKLSGVQMRALRPMIEAGKVLLLSQFYPDAQWTKFRAMDRNKVVTGLAQIVIVAQSSTKGGTWEGAQEALRQRKPVYVRNTSDPSLAGNHALIKQGAKPLSWPVDDIAELLNPLLEKSSVLQEQEQRKQEQPGQLSLLAYTNED